MYAKQMTKDISKIHQEEKQIQYQQQQQQQQQQQPSPEQQQQQLMEATKALTQALSAFQSSLKSG
jgi:hypothetical protein